MDKFNDVYRTDMAVTVDEAGFKEQTMIEYGREKTVFVAPKEANDDSDNSAPNTDSTRSMAGYLKEDDADLKYAPITAPDSTSMSDSDVVLIKSGNAFKAVSISVLKDYLLA